MANYRQTRPINYSPYISQIPLQPMLQVGSQEQLNYNVAVDKIQSQVNQLGALDIARSQGRAYVNQRLNDLVNKINVAAGSNFSDPNVFNQLTAMAGTIGNDQTIVNEVVGTQMMRSKQKEITTLKEKNPELYSQKNEEYAMMDINKWLSDGSPAGTKLNDRRSFSPWYDSEKEATDLTKDFLSRPDEFTTETLDPNTGQIIKKTYKGKTADQIKQFLNANLSSKAKNQFIIDGTVNGQYISDQEFLRQYQEDKNNQIRSLINDGNQLTQAYHSSSLTTEERNKISLQVNDINKQIQALNADKGNVDYMRAALAQKPDYFGQMYANQKINAMAITREFSENAVTYGTNEATVSQLNRIATRENMMYTQAQENARASMANKLAYDRLAVDSGFKEQELELKRIELGLKSGLQPGMAPFNPNSPSSRYDIQTTGKQDITEQITGQNAYQKYQTETFGKINNYNASKGALYDNLSKIKSYQDDLAKSVGKVWSNMTEPERRNAFDQYLIAKNSDWNKGNQMPKELDDFFNASTELLRDVTVRRNFGNNANEKVLKDMQSLGVSSVTIDGKTFTPEDILRYVTTGFGPIKDLPDGSVAGYENVEYIDPKSGLRGTRVVYTGGLNKYAPLREMVEKFKQSAALKEYYNQFNMSSGQELYKTTRTFDPNNKAQQADFTKMKGLVMGLLQQQDQSKAQSINPNDISPVFHINNSTGEIEGTIISKGKAGRDVITPFKVQNDAMKFNNARDLELQQEMFFNNGATGSILIRGPKPFNVVIKSNSTDAASKFTVGPGLSAAKYTIYDLNNNQIKDPYGGFDSPTAAEDWIKGMGNAITQQEASKWYNSVKDTPQFKSMSDRQQADALSKHLENIDPSNNMQFQSNNVMMNILQGLKNTK